jgi:predicted nucleotidyltransferase
MTKKLKNRINKITSQIVSKYKPEKVILFGSAARGRYSENSDLDFFIVKHTNRRFHQRYTEAKKHLGNTPYKTSIDLVVWTPEEFKKGKMENRFFLEQVLKEGKVLYEKK